MRAIRESAGTLAREAALGAWLGLWFLGIGGRLAMRAVALALGQTPTLNAGGTFTVVAAGTGAGIAGTLLYAVSRAVTAWLGGTRVVERAHGGVWVRALRLALFAALLALVTARGLHGSPGPTWYFWLLVAAYGAALEFTLIRRGRHRVRPAVSAAPVTT